MLTLRHKLEIAGALLALLALAIVGGSWLGAREDGIRLKATLAAQNSVLADAGKREAAREAVLKDSLAQLEDLKKRTQTPTQVIRALPGVLPLPQPITLSLPAALAQGDPSKAGVQPGQTATIPAADLKPLFDFAADCKACRERVMVLEQNKADDAVKVGALVKERDAAVTAAKGGSKWQRIKRAAKWFAIGAAAGAIAAKAAR
ncbi:MAG: hypothetical protein LAN84_00175 [Acidobacteriia bacterium]|nr:hypothetical protein [Terriglobia bacterium]